MPASPSHNFSVGTMSLFQSLFSSHGLTRHWGSEGRMGRIPGPSELSALTSGIPVLSQSTICCCLLSLKKARPKEGVGRREEGSSSPPQPTLSSGLGVRTGRGVGMPLLGNGARGEPQKASTSILQVAQGPGKSRLTVKVGRLFLSMVILLVLFWEGTGKWGCRRKS